ncbi:MAG: MFS transporter [Anaerolineae bacterium]
MTLPSQASTHTLTKTAVRAHSRRGLLVLYIAAVVFYWMSLYLYVPTLSVYAAMKTDDLALVGIVLAQYGLWQAVTRFPLGILADWIGRRKPFILAGFALGGLGALWMGLTGSINGLIVGRALSGLAASVWVLLVVAVNSQFPPEEAVRITALLSGVNSVARMAATSVTGALNDWGGYPLAFFAAAGTAALAMVAMLIVREPARPSKRPSLGSLGKLITRRDVLTPSLLCAVSQFAIWAGPFTFSPILAKSLGATDGTLSLLTSLNIAMVMLSSFATSAVAKRVSARWLVVFNFSVIALSMVMLTFARSLTLVFAAQICFGLASGIGYSVLMGLSIRDVGETQRATAMGLFQAVYGIGMFAGPWLSGILAGAIGIQPMFGVVGGGCLLIGLLGVQQLAKD